MVRMSSLREEIEQIVFCTTGCGSNADPADGFGYCTCGAEKQVDAILKAVKERVPKRKWLKTGELISTKQFEVKGYNEAIQAIHKEIGK